MELYTELLIFLLLLFLLLAALAVLSVHSRRRHAGELRQLLEQRQLHADYLSHIDSLSREIYALSAQVRNLVDVRSHAEEGSLPFAENRACLSGCDHFLHLACTENPVVNALLFSKRTACEAQGIQFSANIHALPKDGIAEVELTALLGNLLDNAMEAAAAAGAERPFVHLSSEIKKSVWIVKTENTKDPAVQPISRGMKTNKAKKQEHGLGLSIIAQLTEQYDGSLAFQDTGECFQVTAMLMLPKKV